MRKASIITLATLGLLFLIGLYYYNKLGGFNEPEIKIITAPGYTIAGQEFNGKLVSIGKAFEKVERDLKEGKIKGDVAGVFYNNPEKSSDTIKAFIGVVLKDSLNTIPEDYSIRKVESRKVVQAHIKAHILVAPDIYPEIEEYAKENKIELKRVPALEIYPSEEEMFIQIPVK